MCMKTDIGTLLCIIFWEKSQKMSSVSNKKTGDFWCVLETSGACQQGRVEAFLLSVSIDHIEQNLWLNEHNLVRKSAIIEDNSRHMDMFVKMIILNTDTRCFGC